MLHPTTSIKQQPPSLVVLPSPAPAAGPGAPLADALTLDYLAIVFETVLGRLLPSQGFLLLDAQGHLLQSNPKARSLCKTLRSAAPRPPAHPAPGPLKEPLPEAIEKIAHCLIESRQLFPERPIQLQDDIFRGDQTRIRIQAEWITLADQQPPYMVVVLADLTEVAHQRARLDVFRYQLTPREAEVWQLSLQGLSYRQVGQELVISINTVKRHMKRIYEKRELLQGAMTG